MSDFHVITPYEARLLAFMRLCHPKTEDAFQIREEHEKNKNSSSQITHQTEFDFRFREHVD